MKQCFNEKGIVNTLSMNKICEQYKISVETLKSQCRTLYIDDMISIIFKKCGM